MAIIKYYKFVVESDENCFNFPFDMLRYDSCYPADGDSVKEMLESLEPSIRNCRRTGNGKFTVTLLSQYLPTEDRWKSFSWKVVKCVGQR